MESEFGFYVIIIGLVIVAVGLFWALSRRQHDVQELQYDIEQQQQQSILHVQKIEQLSSEKNQLEQWALRQQMSAEALQTRLLERENAIQTLQHQIQQAAAQEDQLERYINELKERVGAAQAKAEQLGQQLQYSQQQLEQQAGHLASNLQELAELRTTLTEKQANFDQQQRDFVTMREQMNMEFNQLAQRIFDEKSRSLTQTNQSTLDLLLKPFKEQIDGFQKRVNEVHSEAIKGHANLEAEIKRVLSVGLSMSQDAQNLTSALKGNNKIAGNWGEIQLETALQSAGLLSGEHYVAQESYRDAEGKRFSPDFVVKLPDDKHLILDSKVSLIAYEKAVNADDPLAIQKALEAHCSSLRHHIDGLSKKNYSHLLGLKSPDFVLMFVPIEPAYIEAMKFDTQLFNYGYAHNVILVSYTTLMPILRTVANLWRIERGNQDAQEISAKAGEIYNQICTVAERLSKLGNTLNSASNQYNQTVTALVGKQGLLGKVERFQQLSHKASQQVPQVEMLTHDWDTNRLDVIVEKESDNSCC